MKSRKELKAAYKQKHAPMGVFQIRNTVSGKVLIDSSTDMPSSWNRHRSELRFGSHRNRALQQDWKEQGEDDFVFEVLSELERGDKEGVDYQKELRTLQDLIMQELKLGDEKIY